MEKLWTPLAEGLSPTTQRRPRAKRVCRLTHGPCSGRPGAGGSPKPFRSTQTRSDRSSEESVEFLWPFAPFAPADVLVHAFLLNPQRLDPPSLARTLTPQLARVLYLTRTDPLQTRANPCKPAQTATQRRACGSRTQSLVHCGGTRKKFLATDQGTHE